MANLAFGPEKAKTYEGGIRAVLFDNRVRANLTGFYNDVTGKQLTVFLPEFNVGAVQNVGEAYTAGAEFETEARLAPGLDFSGNVGYLKAKITDWPNAFGCPANCTDGDDVDLVYAPKWTANARLSYEAPIGGDFVAGMSGEVQYQGRAYTRTPNGTVLDLTRTSEPGTYLNASAWLKPNENWTLKALVRNIADEDYQIYNFGIPGISDGISYTIPRTVLVTLSYSY